MTNNVMYEAPDLPKADFFDIWSAYYRDLKDIKSGRNTSSAYDDWCSPSYLFCPIEFVQKLLAYDEPASVYHSRPHYLRLYECPESHYHQTHEWVGHISEVCVNGVGPLTPYLVESDQMPLINEELADILRDAGLNGLQVGEAGMDFENNAWDRQEQAFFLSGPKPLPRVVGQISKSFQNECPFCGFGPVVCIACGCQIHSKCPSCKENIFRRLYVRDPSTLDEKEEQRLRFSDAFPDYIPINRARGCIDGRLRDPDLDFAGLCSFSHRALRLLLEANAYPINVMPMKTLYDDNTIGYTHEDAVPLEAYYPEVDN